MRRNGDKGLASMIGPLRDPAFWVLVVASASVFSICTVLYRRLDNLETRMFPFLPRVPKVIEDWVRIVGGVVGIFGVVGALIWLARG